MKKKRKEKEKEKNRERKRKEWEKKRKRESKVEKIRREKSFDNDDSSITTAILNGLR